VLADSFSQVAFRESLRRAFERHSDPAAVAAGTAPTNNQLLMGFGGHIEVIHSREFKIAGAIGSCASAKKAGPTIAETEIGIGGTSAWYLGGVDPAATMAFYFEVASTNATALPQYKRRFIQFLTTYQASNGKYRLRVSTVCGLWHCDPNDVTPIARSFDQEAATVLVSRLAAYKCEHEDHADVMRWLDRSLIKLCSKFATYKKDDPSSFRLPSEFSLYPQFMFHLRRSKFLQNFNSSPDEQAVYRYILMRESTSNVVIMVPHPLTHLLTYSLTHSLTHSLS
jgi:protein transport protein SEC23